MSDNRKNNGGHSTKGKAGRKSKDEEQRIRDLVSPYVDGAIEKVVNIMINGDKSSDQLSAAKLILEYRFGKPEQKQDITSNGKEINIPLMKWADDTSEPEV